MSNVDQIRALEELAAMDAEVKALEEKLAEERGVLGGLTESLKQLDERLQADTHTVGAADKQAPELQIDIRTMTVADRALAREAEPVTDGAREPGGAARARGAPEARARPRGRDPAHRQRHRLRYVPQLAATEAEHKSLTDELSGKEGDIEAKVAQLEDGSTVEGRRPRRHRRSGCRAALYRRYEMIRGRRGSGDRPDNGRHLQQMQHGAAAAALSSTATRAAHRAVPVVQPDHLLRVARSRPPRVD